MKKKFLLILVLFCSNIITYSHEWNKYDQIYSDIFDSIWSDNSFFRKNLCVKLKIENNKNILKANYSDLKYKYCYYLLSNKSELSKNEIDTLPFDSLNIVILIQYKDIIGEIILNKSNNNCWTADFIEYSKDDQIYNTVLYIWNRRLFKIHKYTFVGDDCFWIEDNNNYVYYNNFDHSFYDIKYLNKIRWNFYE